MEEFAALTCYALLEARCKPPQPPSREKGNDRSPQTLPARYTLVGFRQSLSLVEFAADIILNFPLIS
jgi:hypothetical protein